MNLSGQTIFAPKKVYVSQRQDETNDDLLNKSYPFSQPLNESSQDFGVLDFSTIPHQPLIHEPDFQEFTCSSNTYSYERDFLNDGLCNENQETVLSNPFDASIILNLSNDTQLDEFEFFSSNKYTGSYVNQTPESSSLQSNVTCNSDAQNMKMKLMENFSTSALQNRLGVNLQKVIKYDNEKEKKIKSINLHDLKHYQKSARIYVSDDTVKSKSSDVGVQGNSTCDKNALLSRNICRTYAQNDIKSTSFSTFNGTEHVSNNKSSASASNIVTLSTSSASLSSSVDSTSSNPCGITSAVSPAQTVNNSDITSTTQVPDTAKSSKRRDITLSDIQEKSICQVCGDKASGFYCGAFVCEACKKFFMRANKQEKLKYVCLREKSCVITKESRVQCQYCRYQKCLKLNMYCPGAVGKSEKVVGEIPCRVCSAPSSGFHFGALTCEGCKGFFRRMAKERGTKSYQCPRKDQCEINALTRNLCKACRYKKCFDVGMSIEGSRIGRQSNSVKHAISLELQKKVKENTELKEEDCVQKSVNSDIQKSIPVVPNELPPLPEVHVIKDEPLSPKDEIENVSKSDLIINQILEGNELLCCINKVPEVATLVRKAFLWTDIETAWTGLMESFEENVQCIIKFSKKVPSFRCLSMEDQVALIQHGTYPLVILNMSRVYDIHTKKYNYFNYTEAERDRIFVLFPMLRYLGDHFQHVGNISKLLNFSDIEYTFLSAMLLLNGDVQELRDKDQVVKFQKEIMDALCDYEESNHPDGVTRAGIIFLRLPELQCTNIKYTSAMAMLMKCHPMLKITQLYRELFEEQMNF